MIKKLKLTDYIIIAIVIVLVAVAAIFVIKKKNFSNLPVE